MEQSASLAKTSSSVAAIIVAAGRGLRMGMPQKKQYLMLCGRPVIAHTLLAFDRCDAIKEIFLVIGKEDRETCKSQILAAEKLNKPIHLVSGGEQRQQSVLNGLIAMGECFEWVAIHDGVRPMVTPKDISQYIHAAEKNGALIPANLPADTVKQVNGDDYVTATLNRPSLRMVQTPQVFRYSIIWKAHHLAQSEGYTGTDDAELVERMGIAVKVVQGRPDNIKITTPADIIIAQALISAQRDGLASTAIPSNFSATS